MKMILLMLKKKITVTENYYCFQQIADSRCSATEYQISNKTSLLALGSELNLKNVVLMERTAGDPMK